MSSCPPPIWLRRTGPPISPAPPTPPAGSPSRPLTPNLSNPASTAPCACPDLSKDLRLFGLTGGIGMGKSTAEKLLRERGIPVVDTDFLARQVVEPGQPALAEIQHAFGQDF